MSRKRNLGKLLALVLRFLRFVLKHGEERGDEPLGLCEVLLPCPVHFGAEDGAL